MYFCLLFFLPIHPIRIIRRASHRLIVLPGKSPGDGRTRIGSGDRMEEQLDRTIPVICNIARFPAVGPWPVT